MSRPRSRRDPGKRPAPFQAAFALGLAILMGLVWWWTHPPDPARAVLAHHRPLAALARVPLPGPGKNLERWFMIAGPDTVTGLWRASPRPRPEWVVVLLGGIGTDDRSALLVPDSLPVGVLAVSWPWRGPRRMDRHEFLASVPAMRTALLSTPGAIARGLEAVRQTCPGSRVSLIGASLGVPPTVAALPLAHPEALVLVDGAADLPRLLRSEISRELGRGPWAPVLAPPAAALGARLLSSLEPARYGAYARKTAVLLVDAVREERYPPACIARLHATFPHAAHARHPGGHIRPTRNPDVAATIAMVASWLDTLPTKSVPAPLGRFRQAP